MAATPTRHLDMDAVRARFPALAGGAAYFDGPGGSQVPQEVIDAVDALSLIHI